jgi:hypothetical protein
MSEYVTIPEPQDRITFVFQTRVRKTMPSYKTAMSGLIKSLEEFDRRKIHFSQIREAANIAAAVSSEPS